MLPEMAVERATRLFSWVFLDREPFVNDDPGHVPLKRPKYRFKRNQQIGIRIFVV
jgi:hypothetical protein